MPESEGVDPVVSIERMMDEHARLTALSNALMREALVAPAADVRAMIDGLNRDLVDHLAVEDSEVYPHLLNVGDMAQREVAQIAMCDFDRLAAGWRNFVEDWTAEEIEGDRELFVEACKSVLSALAARTRIENDILYPLALRCGTIALRECNARARAA